MLSVYFTMKQNQHKTGHQLAAQLVKIDSLLKGCIQQTFPNPLEFQLDGAKKMKMVLQQFNQLYAHLVHAPSIYKQYNFMKFAEVTSFSTSNKNLGHKNSSDSSRLLSIIMQLSSHE